MRRLWFILALALVSALAVSVAVAARGKAPARPHRLGTTVTHVQSSPATHAGARSPTATKQDTPAEPNATDTDNVQQGDQATADTPGAGTEDNGATASDGESATEAEAGQPGEPTAGHEDPPGQDVNHECTGDCVE
jgi:hypothetical protein